MSGLRTTVVLPGRPPARIRAWHALRLLLPSAVAVWLLLCAAGWLLTRPLADTAFERWDGSVNRWFAAHRSAPWNAVTHLLALAAETVTVVGIGAVFFVSLRLLLGRWRESMFLAAALAGEVTIFVGATMLIDRDRPAVTHLDIAPPTSSFPSGHTAAAVTLYGGLAVVAVVASSRPWLRALAVVAAVVIPVGVALSRLYRGMHYPTDVIAGALLGIGWLAICAKVLLTSDRRRQ